MGHSTAGHAAGRALTLLAGDDLKHHPATGPGPRRGQPSVPGAPLNLGLLDYLTRTVDEVTAHTAEIAPEAGPRPAQMGELYDWYVDATGDAEPAEQAYRDIVIERHRLEHAIWLGEVDAVCKHPCPGCGRWGLMWDDEGRRAMCSYRRCRTPDGMTSTWSLARLAAQKVQRTEIWRRNAT